MKNIDLEDPKRKSIAAANHFESKQVQQPPSLFAESQNMSLKPQQSSNSSHDQSENQNDATQEEQAPLTTLGIHDLFGATRDGHELFKTTTRFTNVNIMGAMAIGSYGCLSSADVGTYIRAGLQPKIETEEDEKIAKAVSKVIGRHLEEYAKGIIIPSLIWYPAYSYFPGPVAPPLPNVPTPLSILPSVNEYLLTQRNVIKMQILNELPYPMRTDANENLIEGFADLTSNYFDQWINTTFLTNILGSGNVPSFSPPFVLGGPVLGKVIPTPGVLS